MGTMKYGGYNNAPKDGNQIMGAIVLAVGGVLGILSCLLLCALTMSGAG